eukprot:Skav230266  [mRNA]  locus=scaffold3387:222031:222828:+ [translate_table: standard]
MELVQSTELASWAALYNRMADVAAGQGLLQRYREHCCQVDLVRKTNRAVQQTLLQVSKAVFRSTWESEDPLSPDPVVVQAPAEGTPWSWAVTEDVSAALVHKWGRDYTQCLFDWVTSAMAEVTDDVHPCWVSTYQLFVDFVLATGHCGVLCLQGRWNTEGRSTQQLVGYSFKQRCTWWIHSFKDHVSDRGFTPDTKYTRPRSDVLHLHCGCWWMKWNPRRLELVDDWFCQHLKSTATRSGEALKGLNPISRGALPTPAPHELKVR